MGDFNSYYYEDPMQVFYNNGYTNEIASSSYSYRYSGQWGMLDHVVSSTSMTSQVIGAADWHINSDEATYLDYNDEIQDTGEYSYEVKPTGANTVYAADPFSSSDHDPILVGLDLNANADVTVVISESADPATQGSTITYTFDVQNTGAAPATATTLNYTLPANLSFVNFTTNPGGACNVAGGVMSCSLGTIAAAGSTQIVFDAGAVTVGTFTNTVVVATTATETDTTNNTVTEDTTIAASSAGGGGNNDNNGGNGDDDDNNSIVIILDNEVDGSILDVTTLSQVTGFGINNDLTISVRPNSNLTNVMIYLDIPTGFRLSGTGDFVARFNTVRPLMGRTNAPTRQVARTLSWNLGDIQAGEVYSTQIFGEVAPDFTGNQLVFMGRLVSNEVEIERDFLTLVIPQSLPLTGETPWWRVYVLWSLALGVIAAGTTAAYALNKRRS